MNMLLTIAAVLVAALPINALAFWIGTRAGAAGVARDELLARRRTPRRILGAPAELLHMASFRIDDEVYATGQEAVAIIRGESPAAPTADHLAALAILHADAVRHYDELGARLIEANRRLREAESGRTQLARFIRTEIERSARAEDEIAPAPPKPAAVILVSADRKGRVTLGQPH